MQNTLRNGMIALCFAGLALTGCGKSKMLTASEAYEKDACECKDVACITAATTKYTSAMAGETPKSSEAEAIGKAATNASVCMSKVTTAAVPGMMKK
jgi:hypothetical protein